ncbi:uncharacterized protein LOC116291298 [Actinia tenebrosa]|uniref:Uncharacterized protein LOC116291298 n=1 Tax=Actinia tenebrosa TaxID=6105 RepID=A0A6P8HEZ5_ACTTE|nr:uncharacterized protein LOC116291298 [Actinia tenebrosa]XP_031554321.1 uncharacterized protein LOC116291298 [Actinia tenebrosa]XP_031554323.1 uncharacterized protein LOC116291298 [Actinia tenebrosa]
MTTNTQQPAKPSKLIKPNSFEPNNHWVHKGYEKPIDPVAKYFLELDGSSIVRRYCMLHPMVSKEKLETLLAYQPRYFLWAGADLMKVASKDGEKKMVLIENNSCPSGQKYMPLVDKEQKHGGYRTFLERTFKTTLNSRRLVQGELAVLYDKNPIETTGYAHAMADLFNEEVHFVSAYIDETNPAFEFRDGVLHVFGEDQTWHPIRAAFRYVTQRPWNRLPISSKTLIVNPSIVCLAGGRNKLLASKAYTSFNKELLDTGLAINTPLTICDVQRRDIPNWVAKFGGQAVIKIPYSNAGQGVYIIKNEEQLQDFLNENHPYELYIVQELIGLREEGHEGVQRYTHIGTLPSEKGCVYVSDVRMMVSSSPTGLRPVGMYSRRAGRPIVDGFGEVSDHAEAFMTNLSFKNPDGTWNSDVDRMIRHDCHNFLQLGLGLDDLIEAYVQTVLSTIAIDKMAQALCDENGQFSKEVFQSLNDDSLLLSEIMNV